MDNDKVTDTLVAIIVDLLDAVSDAISAVEGQLPDQGVNANRKIKRSRDMAEALRELRQ